MFVYYYARVFYVEHGMKMIKKTIYIYVYV